MGGTIFLTLAKIKRWTIWHLLSHFKNLLGSVKLLFQEKNFHFSNRLWEFFNDFGWKNSFQRSFCSWFLDLTLRTWKLLKIIKSGRIETIKINILCVWLLGGNMHIEVHILLRFWYHLFSPKQPTNIKWVYA